MRLRGAHGFEADVLGWGATLQALRVPDRRGRLTDVVLGFDDAAAYREPHPFIGGTVGRYANRVAGGRFVLDAREHQLSLNDGTHHLHGGVRGFHQHPWTVAARAPTAVTLTRRSPDGEEGYPGTLDATVTYALVDLTLRIIHEAVSDRPTIVNLSHHSYWNLRDGGVTDIGDHRLTITADAYTPVDASGIPTGAITPVDGGDFDFRTPRRLRDALAHLASDRGGYDHHFVVGHAPGVMRLVARLSDEQAGRVMEVWSDAPGVQLYTGNFLDGSLRGKGGLAYQRHAGLCLETQAFPNAPNAPQFPSVVLRQGETYRHCVEYRFGR